jgi:hypothetical protein
MALGSAEAVKEVREMAFNAGDRVMIEAESTEQTPRRGVVEEVLRERPERYRIRWDDGHESILRPEAGCLKSAERLETGASS